MPYVIKKNGKYLKSHSYATGQGYRFQWTPDLDEAVEFCDKNFPHLYNFAALTQGRAKLKEDEARRNGRS